MSMNYAVTGSDRKRLVGIICRQTGLKAQYEGVPTMAYTIGGITVDKTGVMMWDDTVGPDEIQRIAAALKAEGFESEEEESFAAEDYIRANQEESESDNTDAVGLTISLPQAGFSKESLERLHKLIDSKASLIKKSLSTDRLTFRISEDKIEFPWWSRMPSPDETRAYIAFISALCTKAKEAKRINAKDREVQSEKFAFRVFLLNLGFVGPEYKAMRGILMKNLSGSAAFPTQAAADEFSEKQKAKREAEKEATVSAGSSEAG